MQNENPSDVSVERLKGLMRELRHDMADHLGVIGTFFEMYQQNPLGDSVPTMAQMAQDAFEQVVRLIHQADQHLQRGSSN